MNTTKKHNRSSAKSPMELIEKGPGIIFDECFGNDTSAEDQSRNIRKNIRVKGAKPETVPMISIIYQALFSQKTPASDQARNVEKNIESKEISKPMSSQQSVSSKLKERAPEQVDASDKKNKCDFCDSELMEESIVHLVECKHRFHRLCLKRYLKEELKTNELAIGCPVNKCDTQVRFVDMMDIMDPDILEEYIISNMINYVDNADEVSCCPSTKCFYFFSRGKDDKFKCRQCNKEYCLTCKAEWHPNKACQNSKKPRKKSGRRKDDDIEDTGHNQFKICPKCAAWVPRLRNEHFLECKHSKCKIRFCFACGKKTQEQNCDCLEAGRVRPKCSSELFHKY